MITNLWQARSRNSRKIVVFVVIANVESDPV